MNLYWNFIRYGSTHWNYVMQRRSRLSSPLLLVFLLFQIKIQYFSLAKRFKTVIMYSVYLVSIYIDTFIKQVSVSSMMYLMYLYINTSLWYQTCTNMMYSVFLRINAYTQKRRKLVIQMHVYVHRYIPSPIMN